MVDYTSEKDSATPLRCGTDQPSPGELRITGIPEGSYFLTHIETQDEYTLLRNPIEVTLSSGNATVDGWKQIVSIDPDTGEPFVSISIRFSREFTLPVSKLHPISYWSCQTFGFDILSWLPVVGIVGCSIALFFVLRSSRKKNNGAVST